MTRHGVDGSLVKAAIYIFDYHFLGFSGDRRRRCVCIITSSIQAMEFILSVVWRLHDNSGDGVFMDWDMIELGSHELDMKIPETGSMFGSFDI